MTTLTPELELVDGVPMWRLGGRLVPVIAGGDDGEAGGAQGATGGAGGEAQGAGGQGADGSTGEGAEGGEPEADHKLRQENKSLRERLRALEAADAERKAGELSELERERQRAEEAEGKATSAATELRALRLEAKVGQLAGRVGITDPVAAARLMDAERVEWDDNGRPDPDSIEAALRQVVKDHPVLAKAPSIDAGGGGGNGPRGSDMNAILRSHGGRR